MFQQSLDNMEGRVKYITKGLEGEKMVLREIVENMREKVLQKSETSSKEEGNEMEKALDAELNQHMLTAGPKFKEENTAMEKAFDTTLNQLIHTKESKDAEIKEQLMRMSEQLETSRKNYDEALGQFRDISKRLAEINITVKTGVVNRDEQYYISMKQDGWLQFKNYLYKGFDEQVDFDIALKKCEDQDASLVEIFDFDEWYFLSENFRYFWLGATDRETEGEWRWLSGHLIEPHWQYNQPDGGSDENCLWFDSVRQYNYEDEPCNEPWSYVCKRQ